MPEKQCCHRTCNLRYFPGMYVEAWVGSMYHVLLDLSRHNRSRVDGDCAAHLARATGIPHANMNELSDTTCGEA
jgi:hypothetical protein